jgi:hypothetical protein
MFPGRVVAGAERCQDSERDAVRRRNSDESNSIFVALVRVDRLKSLA